MAPSITLYTFPPSQNAVRAELALLEKGLAFEKVPVDVLAGEHRQPPLAELTPRGQVPTLVYDAGDGPIVVYESIATIRFLDDLHPEPPLLPPVSEPRWRAQAIMRVEEFQAKLDPCNIFGSVIFGRKSREELQPRIDALVAELARWDAYATGQRFLAGEQFTLADIAVFPLLMHFEALGFDWAARTPALAAYVETCKQRPSVKQSGWARLLRGAVGRARAGAGAGRLTGEPPRGAAQTWRRNSESPQPVRPSRVHSVMPSPMWVVRPSRRLRSGMKPLDLAVDLVASAVLRLHPGDERAGGRGRCPRTSASISTSRIGVTSSPRTITPPWRSLAPAAAG